MPTDYLSLLKDLGDVQLFGEVYARYQEAVRATVLRTLDPRCDMDKAVDSVWILTACRFQRLKGSASQSNSVFEEWLNKATVNVVDLKNEALSENQDRYSRDELTDFERLVEQALLECAYQEWSGLFPEG